MFVNVKDITAPEGDFTTPQIVGHYSINGDGEYCNDLSQLKYLKISKNLPFNLDDNQGMIMKSGNDIKINYLLQWMIEHFDQLKIEDSNDVIDKWLEADFICYRGLLRTLLATPYDREGWLVCASKFKGSIYLCAYDTDTKKQRILNETAYEKRCSSWGHKFEQFMLAESPSAEPDLSVPQNLNALFGGVFKSQLGNRVLLYGGEIDGICSEDPISETMIGKHIELIELKTIHKSCISNNGKIQQRRANKILNWYLQSQLVGIERIICGCRNNEGIVDYVKEFTVDTLRNDFKRDWNFKRCTKFATGLLEYIRTTVSLNYDKCIYQFTYEPHRYGIRVRELRPAADSEYIFLHSWYINAAKRHFEKGELAN